MCHFVQALVNKVSGYKAITVMLQAIFFLFTDITYVPVCPRTGRVEAADIVSAIKANTVMVTVMLANNETGIVQVSQYARNMLYLCTLLYLT